MATHDELGHLGRWDLERKYIALEARCVRLERIRVMMADYLAGANYSLQEIVEVVYGEEAQKKEVT